MLVLVLVLVMVSGPGDGDGVWCWCLVLVLVSGAGVGTGVARYSGRGLASKLDLETTLDKFTPAANLVKGISSFRGRLMKTSQRSCFSLVLNTFGLALKEGRVCKNP